jgi:hypothetical protein
VPSSEVFSQGRLLAAGLLPHTGADVLEHGFDFQLGYSHIAQRMPDAGCTVCFCWCHRWPFCSRTVWRIWRIWLCVALVRRITLKPKPCSVFAIAVASMAGLASGESLWLPLPTIRARRPRCQWRRVSAPAQVHAGTYARKTRPADIEAGLPFHQNTVRVIAIIQ